MRALYCFLTFTFVAHCAAFTLLAVRRRKPYYFLLTGTFSFLTAIYALKFFSITGTLPGTDVSIRTAFRVCAVSFTLAYLFAISRIEDSWLRRLICKISG